MDNLVLGLIHHRRLVLGIFVHAFRIDALHGIGIVVQTDALERLATAHDAPRAMRSRAVPVFIAFADADEGAVAHVQRDDTFFSGIGRDGTLADDIVIANIVMDAFKLKVVFTHVGVIMRRLIFAHC